MRKLRILTITAAAAVLLCAAGCGGGGSSTYTDNSHDDQLVALASVSGASCSQNSTDLILTAQVSAPDYAKLMEKYHAEAEQNAGDYNDYEKRLYDLMLKDARDAAKQTISVTVNLSDLNATKTEWSEKELEEAAKQAAFDKAAEEFAYKQIMEEAPSLKEAADR